MHDQLNVRYCSTCVTSLGTPGARRLALFYRLMTYILSTKRQTNQAMITEDHGKTGERSPWPDRALCHWVMDQEPYQEYLPF